MADSQSRLEELEKLDVAYSSEPWWYDVRGFLILTFAYRSTLPSQIRLFSRNMGERHLEAAIGTGTLFEMILKWRKFRGAGPSLVTGFDYADRMLAGAKQRLGHYPGIELVKADIADLPFASASFDTANIANAVHCVPNVDAGFRELRRVLKPGGRLAGNVLLFPGGGGPLDRLATRINEWGMREGILKRPYTQQEIRYSLLECGFIFRDESVQGNCYNFVVETP